MGRELSDGLGKHRPRRITVFGAGYTGLSAAVLLAQHNDVTVVDILPEKIDLLRQGISPVREPEIGRFLLEAREGKRKLSLSAAADGDAACREAEFILIAVPTDLNEETGRLDCSKVESVLGTIRANAGDREPVVVIRSTVPVGFTDQARERFRLKKLLFSPEFLRESSALRDCLCPDRIIIGGDPGSMETARETAALFRQGMEKQDVETLYMGCAEAEAVKLFSNTYLALRVGFFNELDSFAETKGLDAAAVIRGVCLDPRIGDHYNNPSFGYGGYCLPKDSRQLMADCAGVPQTLIGAAVEANRIRKEYIAEQVLRRAGARPVIGVYRLGMKTGSADFRESAVLGVAGLLRDRGAEVILYEPALEDGSVYEGMPVVNDLEAFSGKCGCILANRFDPELEGAAAKVYTRDLFQRD